MSAATKSMTREHLVVQVGVGALMVFARLQGGSVTESKALMMSAMLSLLAGLSAAALLLEANAAQRARRKRLRHDSSKHEIAVAGAMSLAVIVGVVGLCGSLLHDLLHHRQHAPCVSGRWYGLIAACGPWLVLLSASMTRSDSPQGPWTTRGLLRHWKIDLIGSVVVLLTLLASRQDGFLFLDSLVALICAAYAIGASSVALRQAIRGLMDASVGDAETEVIRAAVEGVDGVRGVVSLVAIRCGRATRVTAKVELAPTTRMGEAGRIRDLIAVALERQTDNVTEVLVEPAPVRDAPEPSERGS